MQVPNNYKKGQTLGMYIRASREKIGVTLTQFAESIDCSISYLSDVERGKRTITKERLAHIAYRLIRSLFTLLDGTDEQRWLAMYQWLLHLGGMMSWEDQGLIAIKEILDKPKLKKKHKLEAIKAELDVAFYEDYMSWVEDESC